MSKENKKGTPPPQKPTTKAPSTPPREIPDLNWRNDGINPKGDRSNEDFRKPTMETPIPPPPNKNEEHTS